MHLKFAGFPLAVDSAYAGVEQLTKADLGLSPGEEVLLARTPLHAQRVELAHPATGEKLVVEAPLPADFEAVLAALRGLRGGDQFR